MTHVFNKERERERERKKSIVTYMFACFKCYRLIVNQTQQKKKKKKVVVNHAKTQRELVVLSKTWNQLILFACLLLYSIYPSM